MTGRPVPPGEPVRCHGVGSSAAADQDQRRGNIVDLPLRSREGGIRTRDLSVPKAIQADADGLSWTVMAGQSVAAYLHGLQRSAADAG